MHGVTRGRRSKKSANGKNARWIDDENLALQMAAYPCPLERTFATGVQYAQNVVFYRKIFKDHV